MALTSPRFRWNTRLQEVERNSPVMKSGEKGHAVRLIQQAMIDLGISAMPISTRKYGTVDGHYGSETKGAVKKYQASKSLTDDGIVGQNTMQALDADLPRGTANLPALPARSRYVVPGAITIFDQVAGGHSMGCWAYSYAMMLSWKQRQSIPVADAVAGVGPRWVRVFNSNSGLSFSDSARFMRAAGMQVGPMQCFPVSEWGEMLRAYGPLTLYQRTNSLAGAHARILYGVTGDGNPRTTRMMIIDPWNGRTYTETFEKFNAKYESLGSNANITAQIAHW